MRAILTAATGLSLAFTGNALAQVQANEVTKLVTADANTNDRAGYALDLSGPRLVVGARWDSETAFKAGAAYIYEQDDAGWSEVSKLRASDGMADDEFGYDVGLSNNLAVVGARFDDDAGNKSGSAYVYRRIAGVWVEEAKLTASDAFELSEYGSAVAVSNNVIAVGAPADDELGTNTGAVYVYRYDGSNWNEEAKLQSSNARAADTFGFSLALGGDRLVVGTPLGDEGNSNAGIIFVFEYDGSTWNETVQLTASDRASNDNLGRSVALSAGRILAGAPGDDDGNSGAGSAYMFELQDGSWVETAKFNKPNPERFDEFGKSVALWGDAAIVACPQDDDFGTNSGSAFLHYYNGESWEQQAKLLASDGSATDGFGNAVAVGKAGAMLGAPFDDDGGSSSGAAYFFAGTDDCDGNGFSDLVDLLASRASDEDGDGAPDTCCSGDVDGDGKVFLTDLGIFLAMYGTFTPDPLPSDLDGNGYVALEDLQIILVNFGNRCD